MKKLVLSVFLGSVLLAGIIGVAKAEEIRCTANGNAADARTQEILKAFQMRKCHGDAEMIKKYIAAKKVSIKIVDENDYSKEYEKTVRYGKRTAKIDGVLSQDKK